MTENTADTDTGDETPIELLRRVTDGLTSRREVLGTTAKVGAGGALLSAGAGTAAAGGSGGEMSGDSAMVTFDDQESTGTSVTVAKAMLPKGGYIAIHDSSLLDGEVTGSVVGVSEYFESGKHEEIDVTLFNVMGADFEDGMSLEDDQTLIAMPHMETNDNETYDFVKTEGKEDGAYTKDGSAVVDKGMVTVVEEMKDEEAMDDDVSDIDILNYALTLEHLEATYYNQFLEEYSEKEVERSEAARVFADPGSRFGTYQKIEEVRDHEEAHVETLTQTIEDLGGTPVEAGEYEFPYETIEDFVSLSATIEAVGVSAYAGAAPLIENDDLIPPALSIHSVEARHTSYFNVLNTTSPFPNAFDEARTMDEVLEIASQFIVSDE